MSVLTEFLQLALMAVMTAAGVGFAERRLKGRSVALGCFFGALAVVANTCSVMSVAEYGIALSLRDAPVIAAALYFGPVPGVIAGAIAAVERAATPFFGVGAPTWCPLATFLVALIAAAVRKWFLDGKRPYLLQTLMFGVVFETLHLSFDVLMGLDRLGRCCEIVFSAFTPEAVGISLALVCSNVVLGRHDGLRAFWSSRASRLLVSYLGFLAVTVSCIMVCSEVESRVMVAGAVRRLDHLLDSQIDSVLHSDAAWLAEKLVKNGEIDHEFLDKVLGESEYDELCVAGPDGKVRYSNDPDYVGFDYHTNPKTRRYLNLLDGTETYFSEEFRPCVVDPLKRDIKYTAMSLPDGIGFIQMGFFRKRFENGFETFFFPLFNGVMNFLQDDYTVIASTNDWVVALANGGHEDLVGKPLLQVGIRPGDPHARINGEWCHIGEKQVGEWRIFCVLPLVESYGEGMVISAVLSILLFVLIFGFRLVILHLRHQQEKIDRLRAEVDASRQRDLETAAKIQQSSLPTDFPSGPHFSFFAKMRPAKEVGGDFYDCYPLRGGRIAMAVADVSGKGVPAAMFMIRAKSVLKSSVIRNADLAAAAADANDRLEHNNEAEMFVTAWVGVYDPATGVVDYVNAGHNPPLIRRADGSAEWLRARGGSALGVFSGERYRTGSFKLGYGDSLLLYTDGVTEAQDEAGGFYGEDRLVRLLVSSGGEFVTRIFADVEAFAGAAEQADDITAFALDVKP